MIYSRRNQRAPYLLSTDGDRSAKVSPIGTRMRGSAVLRLWMLSLGSTLMVAAISWGIWQQILLNRAADPDYAVEALVQTGPEVEPLPSSYLAEMLGLSVDQPVNLHQLHLPSLQKKLTQSPCIAQATLQRIGKNTLQVTYTARQPVAVLADLNNSLLGADGAILPYQPFFRPRRLPSIFLGVQPEAVKKLGKAIWGSPTHPKVSSLANDMLKHPLWNELDLVWLDLSHAFDQDYALAELVIGCQIKDSGHTLWVRLSPRYWLEGLTHLQCLASQSSILSDTQIADLRMPMVAILHPK
jgi:hypothetical protein